MSENIRQLKPCGNAVLALRNIADQIESGEINAEECTVIVGAEVYHCGQHNDTIAVTNAVFNMVFGISKIMIAANGGSDT